MWSKSSPKPFLFFSEKSAAAGFLDLGSLALQIAQIVQLRPADLAATDPFDMIHTGGMQRESAFYADTVGYAANGKGLATGTVALCDHGALKRLKTFAVAFYNLHEYAERIANVEAGQIGSELRLFDRTDNLAHEWGPPSLIDVLTGISCPQRTAR